MGFNKTLGYPFKIFAPALALLVVSVALSACTTVDKSPQIHAAPVAEAPPTPENSKFMGDDVRKIFHGYLGAILAESRGDIDTAGKLYLRAMRADINNPVVRDRAFSLLLAAGDYSGAVEVAKISKQQGDAAPLVNMLLTFDFAITGKFTEALEALATLRADSPDLVQFELIESYIKLAKGEDIDGIIANLEAFKPGTGLVVYKYYHLGRLYERKGDMTAAIRAYRSGQMLDPTALFIVTRLGKVLEAQDQPEAARAVYNSFLALNPNSLLIDSSIQRLNRGEKVTLTPQKIDDDLAEVMYGLASIMMAQRIYLTTRQFLHLALMAKPTHPLAMFTLGLMEEQDKNHDRALAVYKKIKPDMMPYMAAQVRIAESYFQTGEKEKSVAFLEDLLKTRPDARMVRYALAQNYFDMKNFAKSAAIYSTLIADIQPPEDRPHASLYFARGAAYERMKDYENATADLTRALALDPQNPVVLNYLGYMWIDQGKNIDQGYDYIKQAVLLRPNDGAIVDSLGWVYYKRGKFDLAARYLEKAVSLMPDDATINMHLGDVYSKLGRKNEARVQWRRALDLGPDTEADKQRLQQLMTQN